jgi:hypothetical protein
MRAEDKLLVRADLANSKLDGVKLKRTTEQQNLTYFDIVALSGPAWLIEIRKNAVAFTVGNVW